MKLTHTQTSVLLIGQSLRQMDRLLETLGSVGVHMMFADDSVEALRSMRSARPDIVLSEMELSDGSGVELCRTMRAINLLAAIPVVLVSRTERGITGTFDALSAGADDILAEEFDPNQFIAKIVWLIERRNFETARKQHFEALKMRHAVTLDIVRETSALFQDLSDQRKGSDSSISVDHRIELGLSMIGGLASLLDEQVRAIDVWEVPARDRSGPLFVRS